MGFIIAAVVIVVAAVGGVVGYHVYANRMVSSVNVSRDTITERIPVDTIEDGTTGTTDDGVSTGDTTTEETELLALVDSEEEAQKIADQYGIMLSSYAFGVAIYTTDQDVDALFQLGKEMGYPELSINTDTYELFDE